MTIKVIHVTCVCITVSLFLLRGGLALAAVDWRRWRPLRWLPHVNDTILLVAGASLAIQSSQLPIRQPWLTAKLVGLVVYVLCGRMALVPAVSRRRRAIWFVAALAAVSYIVAVALTKHVLP